MKTNQPYQDRACYFIINCLLLSAALLLLNSCTTFEKAFRKYGTTKVDTVYTTVKTIVPNDSVSLRLVTDTTTVYREIRQGRARIIYQRNPNTTIVRADCDSVVIEKKVPQYITKQVWGVDPKYQRQAQERMTVIYCLAGLLILAALVYTFVHQLKISIAKR